MNFLFPFQLTGGTHLPSLLFFLTVNAATLALYTAVVVVTAKALL